MARHLDSVAEPDVFPVLLVVELRLGEVVRSARVLVAVHIADNLRRSMGVPGLRGAHGLVVMRGDVVADGHPQGVAVRPPVGEKGVVAVG